MASYGLRVAVIGAGAAGLCSARHILARPATFEPPVVFEMAGQVGGTWVYSDPSENDAQSHSPMYRDLKTNLPKEIMEFPDFPFDPSLPSFIHHSDVLKYLEEYTDKFSIRPHIKFNSRVASVSPVLSDGDQRKVSWDVTVHHHDDDKQVAQRFDAVMVCVGHYSHTFIPNIAGIEKFQGQVLHSNSYRYPEVFSSRSVVLLGSGPSGVDIAIELSQHAKHVTLSHRGPPMQWTPPQNFSVAPPVVGASPNTLICEDGTEIMADTLIFCTGYKYNYPFLLPSEEQVVNQEKGGNGEPTRKRNFITCEGEGCGTILDSNEGLERNGERLLFNENMSIKRDDSNLSLLEDEDIVGPDVGQGHLPLLYRHLLHARYPTMCFIGACKIIVPFPLCHCQVQFFLSVLEGKCRIPPPEQMLSESLEELRNHQRAGLPLKYLHRLSSDQWDYNQWLADTAGFEPLAPVLKKLYEAIRDFRSLNPVLYRSFNITILNKEEFEIQKDPVRDTDE
ncbi:uncharacterized protein LOC134936005 [Pseudophryne corroboree]|uniref:uncharacterized protein LOC134936005 n=1 Tax=Pseudophryne corroboree TaxID=495146 RepID=UPI003081F4E9